MSAEIPGAKPEFKRATNKTTGLVTKILIVTGERSDIANIYGYKAGAYAGEIILTALNNAGLLSPDFTPEKLDEAVSAIDAQMALDSWVVNLGARN